MLKNADSTAYARIVNNIKDLKKAEITKDAMQGSFYLISSYDGTLYDYIYVYRHNKLMFYHLKTRRCVI